MSNLKNIRDDIKFFETKENASEYAAILVILKNTEKELIEKESKNKNREKIIE